MALMSCAVASTVCGTLPRVVHVDTYDHYDQDDTRLWGNEPCHIPLSFCQIHWSYSVDKSTCGLLQAHGYISRELLRVVPWLRLEYLRTCESLVKVQMIGRSLRDIKAWIRAATHAKKGSYSHVTEVIKT